MGLETVFASDRMTDTPERIVVVDILKGIAVVGMCLIHSIGHFNLQLRPVEHNPWLMLTDQVVKDVVSILFQWQVYVLFALLFGFSFWIQRERAMLKGKDFTGRYVWRLVLLFLIGNLNALFFPGDILVLYALLGIVLIPVARLKTTYVLIIAGVCMLQPVMWGKVIYAWMYHPDFPGESISGFYFHQVWQVLKDGSLPEAIRVNWKEGQLASLAWAWEQGRFFQTAALFMLGMVVARKKLLTAGERQLHWGKIGLLIGVLLWGFCGYIGEKVAAEVYNGYAAWLIKRIFNTWSDFGGMLVWGFGIFLLYHRMGKRRLWTGLASYGRMSLTNYVMQSVIGSFVFYGWGLGGYRTCGITGSFLIGCIICAGQMGFSVWWLKHHRHGVLEGWWRKATWAEFKHHLK